MRSTKVSLTSRRPESFQRHPFQRPGAVVVRPELAASVFDILRVGHEFHPVERVVANGGSVSPGIEGTAAGLVQSTRKASTFHPGGGRTEHAKDRRVAHDSPRFFQQVALEIVGLEDEKTGFIEMSREPAQAVRRPVGCPVGSRLVGAPGIAVFQPFTQGQRSDLSPSRAHSRIGRFKLS